MGGLHHLLDRGGIVIAETYPAEFYKRLGVLFPPARAGQRSGKRVCAARAACANALENWAAGANVELPPALRRSIREGFGDRRDGEDRFDAVVGLFGMLGIVAGRYEPGECDNRVVRTVEGWILGQRSPDDLRAGPRHGAAAYLRTTFWAYTPDDAVSIRAEESTPALDRLLERHYECQKNQTIFGRVGCFNFRGLDVDQAIERILLQRLAAPPIEELKRTLAQTRAGVRVAAERAQAEHAQWSIPEPIRRVWSRE